MSLITKVSQFFKGWGKGAPPPGHSGNAQSPTATRHTTAAGTGDGDASKSDGR